MSSSNCMPRLSPTVVPARGSASEAKGSAGFSGSETGPADSAVVLGADGGVLKGPVMATDVVVVDRAAVVAVESVVLGAAADPVVLVVTSG